MDTADALVGTFLVFVGVHYSVLPRLERAVPPTDRPGVVRRACAIAAFRVVRSLSGLSLLVLTAFGYGMNLLGFLPQGEEQLVASLESTRRLNELFVAWSVGTHGWIAAVVLAGLCVALALVSAWRRAGAGYDDAVRIALAALNRRVEEGRAEALPPTVEMKTLDMALRSKDMELDRIEAMEASGGLDRVHAHAARYRTFGDMMRLAATRNELDVRRRLEVRVVVAPPERRDRSWSAIEALGRPGRWSFVAALLLFVPAFAGVWAEQAATLLQVREVQELDRFQARLEADEMFRGR